MTIDAFEYLSSKEIYSRVFFGVDGILVSGTLLQNIGLLRVKLSARSKREWSSKNDPVEVFSMNMKKVKSDPNITTKQGLSQI